MPNVVALVLALVLQATPQELIDKLQSERIQDRTAAQKQLAQLGKAAVPDLEQAAKSPDPELARRAAIVLRQIALQDILSPALLQAAPNAAELLASGSDLTYAQLFLRLSRNTSKLKPADLEPLALPALRGAEGKDKRQIMSLIMAWKLVSALPELLRLARDPGDVQGDYALQTIVKMDPAAGRPLLLDLLKHPNAQIRGRGLSSFQRVCTAADVPLIAPLLDDSEATVRGSAILTLDALKATDETPRIVACLRDKEPIVSSYATRTLINWQAVQAVPLLLPLLEDPQPRVRSRTIEILAQIRAREAAAAIVKRLKDESAGVRAAAAFALVDLDAPTDFARLGPLLAETDPEVLSAGLWAVTSFGHPLPDTDLAGFLGHEEPDIHLLAAWAAGRSKDPKVAPALIKLLEERSTPSHAAFAAGTHGMKETLPVLLKLASGRTLGAASATKAAAELAEESTLPALLDLLVSDNADAPDLVAPAFRRLQPPGLVDQVVEKMKDAPFRDRRIRFLGALKDPRAAAPLMGILSDEREPILLRGAAALALGRIGHKAAVPGITALVEKDAGKAAEDAVHALHLLDAKETVKDLLRRLPQARGTLQTELLRACCALGSTDLLQTLPPLLDDLSGPGDRIAATWLCNAGRREGLQWIMDEGDSLLPANSFRNPDAWKKLTGVVLTGDVEGTYFEIAQRIASEAGLTLDWRRQEFIPDISDLVRRFRIPPHGESARADEVLVALMKQMDDDYDVVLEGNTLRILPSHRARTIFREWWKGNPLNKDR